MRRDGAIDPASETNATTAMRASGARARAAMARVRGAANAIGFVVGVSQNVARRWRWEGRRRREEVFIMATREERREKTEGGVAAVWTEEVGGTSPGLWWRRQALCPAGRVAVGSPMRTWRIRSGRRLLAAALWPKMPRHP